MTSRIIDGEYGHGALGRKGEPKRKAGGVGERRAAAGRPRAMAPATGRVGPMTAATLIGNTADAGRGIAEPAL
ncbi:MAG: hypothetical protein R6V58_08555 [Planctomycetota bacterium]